MKKKNILEVKAKKKKKKILLRKHHIERKADSKYSLRCVMLALALWPSEMLVLELTCNFLFSQE